MKKLTATNMKEVFLLTPVIVKTNKRPMAKDFSKMNVRYEMGS